MTAFNCHALLQMLTEEHEGTCFLAIPLSLLSIGVLPETLLSIVGVL